MQIDSEIQFTAGDVHGATCTCMLFPQDPCIDKVVKVSMGLMLGGAGMAMGTATQWLRHRISSSSQDALMYSGLGLLLLGSLMGYFTVIIVSVRERRGEYYQRLGSSQGQEEPREPKANA